MVTVMTRPAHSSAAFPIRFWALFIPHLIVAPIALLTAVTFLHELAHAAAILALGGTVTQFSFLPSQGHLGHVQWQAPPGTTSSAHLLVSLAPYLMWSACAVGTIVVAWFSRGLHWLLASTIFVWGYVVPLADIAWNLFSGRGDLSVPGWEGVLVQALGAAGLGLAYALGYFVQRRLFADRSVGVVGYVVSSVGIGLAFAAAALIGLWLFR
jgi:hypothetical protein